MKLEDLLPENRARAEVLVGIMEVAQTALWDASFELENILHMDVDTNWDFEDVHLQDLVDRAAEEGHYLGENCDEA